MSYDFIVGSWNRTLGRACLLTSLHTSFPVPARARGSFHITMVTEYSSPLVCNATRCPACWAAAKARVNLYRCAAYLNFRTQCKFSFCVASAWFEDRLMQGAPLHNDGASCVRHPDTQHSPWVIIFMASISECQPWEFMCHKAEHYLMWWVNCSTDSMLLQTGLRSQTIAINGGQNFKCHSYFKTQDNGIATLGSYTT